MTPLPELPSARRLLLRAALAEVSRARRFLEEAAIEAGFARDKVFDITLACSEGIANAIEHAPPQAVVEVRSTRHADRLEVEIAGPGAFQPPRRSQVNPHRGLGLPLMASLSDRMALVSQPQGGTLLTLTYYLPGARREDLEPDPARANDALYRDLVENANSAIIRWSRDGTITYVNEYARAFFGYADGELVGRDVRILVPQQETGGDDLSGLVQDLVAHPERYVNNINENVCRDGRRVWMSWTNRPIRHDGGEVTGILAVGNDITERRRAEQALKDSEEKLRAMFDSITLGLAVIDVIFDEEGRARDYRILETNSVFEQKTGLSAATGLTVVELFGRADPQFLQAYGEVALSGKPVRFESRSEHLGGWYEVSAARIGGEDSRRLIIIFDEITERRLTEQRLKVEQQRAAAGAYVRSLIEVSLDPLVTIGPDGKITDVNQATVEVTGCERERLIGSDFSDYFTDPAGARRGYREVFAKGSVTDYPLTIRGRDGRLTHVLYNASVYRDSEGEVAGVFAAARDITARVQAEEEAERASRYNRSLIEAALDPMVTISPDGKITDVNEATCLVTGRDRRELVGTDFSDYFTDPGRARQGYRQVLAAGSLTDYPLTIRDRQGRTTDVLYNASVYRDTRGEVVGVFAAARDITALKELEEQRNIASVLQAALLDIPRELPGLRFGHLYLSATQGARVGGDFYDVFRVKGDRYVVLIGDVSGHGVEAARIATLVKDVVHAFSRESQHPRLVLRRTNDLLLERQTPGFITLFLGVVDPGAETLTYCSAGHPNALLRTDGGAVTLLKAASAPLGVFASYTWEESRVRLGRGHLLFLYTDGAMEARRGPDFFGQERLVQALGRWTELPPEHVPEAMLEEVLAFSGGQLRDDVALLALQLDGVPGGGGSNQRRGEGAQPSDVPGAAGPVEAAGLSSGGAG